MRYVATTELMVTLAVLLSVVRVRADDEIPAHVVPGVTGHPSYMTHSYSIPLCVRDGHVFIAYLEDDPRTSSSVVHRDPRTGRWSNPIRLGVVLLALARRDANAES